MTESEALNLSIKTLKHIELAIACGAKRGPKATDLTFSPESFRDFLKALAQPEQEPVRREQKMFMDEQEFYTTPPQRKPLTDEEIDEIGYKVYGMKSSTDRQYARAIEAAHGIKEKNT